MCIDMPDYCIGANVGVWMVISFRGKGLVHWVVASLRVVHCVVTQVH